MRGMVREVIDRIEGYGNETFEVVEVEQLYNDKYAFTVVKHAVKEEKNESSK